MGCVDYMTNIFWKMHRKHNLTDTNETSKLRRCLSSWELAFIGLSSMLSGIFIVTATVVHTLAGPGIVLSFLLAGVAAVLSALSYAEIGSLVPRTGSSFVYAAITLGEIWGFLTGWNMILEYTLSSAAMARTFTATVVLMVGDPNATNLMDWTSFEVLGQQTDIMAAAIVAVFATIVGLGVRLTSVINIAFNSLSMVLVFVVSGLAFKYGSMSNWFGHGLDTFFPHGASGVFAGAGACYFSYTGFEVITITGEESLNPRKAVPVAILIAFVMVTTLFVISSLGLTYFTRAINFLPDSALAGIFFNKGFYACGMTLSIAGLLSVCTNVIITLYATPRIFYAMSTDGLIFKWMGVVNESTRTPLNAMIASGVIICFITFFLELVTLVTMVSIGTLTSYILVTIGTLLLRYKPFISGCIPLDPKPSDPDLLDNLVETDSDGNDSFEKKLLLGQRKEWAKKSRFFEMMWPDVHPCFAVLWMSLCIVVLAVVQAIILKTGLFFTLWNVAIEIVFMLPVLYWLIHLMLYEQNKGDGKTYRMPWVPLIPAISIWMNSQFLFMLPWESWVRLILWVSIGLVIYFTYGIKHSVNAEDSFLISEVSDLHTGYGTPGDVTPLGDVTDAQVSPRDDTSSPDQLLENPRAIPAS